MGGGGFYLGEYRTADMPPGTYIETIIGSGLVPGVGG